MIRLRLPNRPVPSRLCLHQGSAHLALFLSELKLVGLVSFLLRPLNAINMRLSQSAILSALSPGILFHPNAKFRHSVLHSTNHRRLPCHA